MATTFSSTRSPRLLVSVRNTFEAEEALAGGADIIDIKEPSRGSLGSATAEVIRAIARMVPAPLPCTAALGELVDWSGFERSVRESIAHLALVKVGTAGLAGRLNAKDRFVRCAEALPPTLRLVPALYADRERAASISWRDGLAWAVAVGSPVLLADTFVKDGRRLMDWMSREELRDLAEGCREERIDLALAGSLRLEDLEEVAEFAGVVAVRGAACLAGDRSATICRQRVRAWADRLQSVASRSVQ